ncbi:putative protease S8 tripeptidyl peptidase I [Talaromyces proteolyticus]|uniref:Protease S8 tripeptidyl peptidase I n=1 Tax=Talaromyces proteolyticus TaxID=1131652 RepID=A0AAD4Q212_9EURO|nr:putative protease S8 tripeptidyl peptidase I [Talaromyces proteolyticus]KAH8703187.1 putative protease S8 tripeptidyl peptidase I [Talaromyces proteolyticus]
MIFLQLAVVSALAALSVAAPSPARHILHEKRHRPSTDWVKTSRVESSAILPIRIGLMQTNLHNGPDYLMEVSDPQSEKYGQYFSMDEVHTMFAPLQEHVNAIKEWLHESGIDKSRLVHSDNKGWLAFDATSEEAERLFQTEYYEHEHTQSDGIRVGCDQYHLPEHIAPHVDYIRPGIKMTQVVKRNVKRAHKKNTRSSHARTALHKTMEVNPPENWSAPEGVPQDLAGCGFNMTAPCIRALYDIPLPANKPNPQNVLGLYEQGDYFAKSDLDLYWKHINPEIPQGTYPTPHLIDGANYSVPANSSLNGGESNIDIEMTISLIYPQETVLYQVDDQLYEPAEVATTNLFNTFLDALDGSYCNYSAYGQTGNDPNIDPIYPDTREGGYQGQLQCGVYKPTNVISASYGQAEADLPQKYVERQCNEFLKLAMQGHTLLFCSGDYGVASSPNDSGHKNGCLGPESRIFNPQYPSGCPWVTSVGGTMLYNDQNVNDSESVMQVNLHGAATNFSSAGGFSNYFKAPWYQELAVAEYFEIGNPQYPYYEKLNVDFNTTKGLYNRIGRGFPDISANGAYFPSFLRGRFTHFFGTSLSAPLWAAVITLINEERLAAGKSTVGFLNPVLYANPYVLKDITNGTSLGCDSDGFAAVEGWDPVTGLGTPDFPRLKELFLALP